MFDGSGVETHAEAVIAAFQCFIVATRARRARVATGDDPIEAVQPYLAVGEQALHAVAGFIGAFYEGGDCEATTPAWVEAVLEVLQA